MFLRSRSTLNVSIWFVYLKCSVQNMYTRRVGGPVASETHCGEAHGKGTLQEVGNKFLCWMVLSFGQ